MNARIFVRCIFIASVAIALVYTSVLNAQTTGKTFGNEVKCETPPNLHLVSPDSVNGKPKFDYFILVKATLNGVYDINGGLQNYETFHVGQIDVWEMTILHASGWTCINC